MINIWIISYTCKGQTSPNRNERISPDPNDIDWTDLKDLFPVDSEFAILDHIESSKNVLQNDNKHTSPTQSDEIRREKIKVAKAKKAKIAKAYNMRRKIESPQAHEEMLKRKRESMRSYRSKMTPEQLEMHRVRHAKSQKVYEEKRLARTGFRSTYLAEIERLKEEEKKGLLTKEDKKKLAFIRKKNSLRNKKYETRKQARKSDAKDK